MNERLVEEFMKRVRCLALEVHPDVYKDFRPWAEQAAQVLREQAQEIDKLRAQLDRAIDGDSGAEHCGPCPHNGGWVNGWDEVRRLRAQLEEKEKLLVYADQVLKDGKRYKAQRDNYKSALDEIRDRLWDADEVLTKVMDCEQRALDDDNPKEERKGK